MNPANPEFVPSASASPITTKGTLAAPSPFGPSYQHHAQTSNSVGVSPHLTPMSVHGAFGSDLSAIQQQRRSSFSPNLSGISSGTSPIGPPSQSVASGASPSLWSSTQIPGSTAAASRLPGADIWGMPVPPASPKMVTNAFLSSPSVANQVISSSPPSHFGNNPFSSAGLVDSTTASTSSPMHSAFLRGANISAPGSSASPSSIAPPWQQLMQQKQQLQQQQQQQQIDPLSNSPGRGSAPVSPTFETQDEMRGSATSPHGTVAPPASVPQSQVDWSSMPMSFASVAADRTGRRN